MPLGPVSASGTVPDERLEASKGKENQEWKARGDREGETDAKATHLSGALHPGAQDSLVPRGVRATMVMPLSLARETSRSPSRRSVFPASTASTRAPTS